MKPLIERIEPQGILIEECSLSGEQKKDGVMPAHPNGIQLSKDRFLLLYSTRGFRGRDDEWSAVYQMRAGSWTGPVLKEGYLSQTSNEWDALGDGRKFVKQHGHPVAFGVPKGALIDGRTVGHENRFVAMWRIVAREIDPETGHVYWTNRNPEILERSKDAQWTQFRLNDRGDDIEITVPVRPLRQKGFGDSQQQTCDNPTVTGLIKGFVCPIPFNKQCTEWVDMNTVNGELGEGLSESKQSARVMPAKYRWNSESGAYEWVECGIPLGPDLFEGGISRHDDGFVICARMPGFSDPEYLAGEPTKLVAWGRTPDPFVSAAEIVKPLDQPNWHPLTAYAAPDGSIVRFGTCVSEYGWHKGRQPLAVMRIDVEDGFREVERWKLCSAEDPTTIPMGRGHPDYDFGKLLPHTGGREQIVLHRVTSTDVWRKPEKRDWTADPQDIKASGIYWEKIIYTDEQPAFWSF